MDADIPTGFVGFPYTFVTNENRANGRIKITRKPYLPVFQPFAQSLDHLCHSLGTGAAFPESTFNQFAI
jgi:hypothetical protein